VSNRRTGPSRVVMFDVDGVLADFTLGFTTLAKEMFPESIMSPWSTLDQPQWEFSGRLVEYQDRVWNRIKQMDDFWSQLHPLASADELTRIANLVNKAEWPIYFVTARVGKTPQPQTEIWLARQGIEYSTVIVSHLKGEAAVVLGATHAIDDKAGNAISTSYMSDAESYIIDRPYNRFDHDVVGGSVRRVKTVGEFLDQVEAA
jgi:FMN phosphatase YigB (HAD superfamily)